MTDTYENKSAWNRAVKNAYKAGVLDDPASCVHVEARTVGEKTAMREMNRHITSMSYSMPDGYDRIFNHDRNTGRAS